MILPQNFHTPVLLPQVIETLKIVKGKKYIDATLGGGGYALEILRRGGRVLGIDQDKDAVDYVKKRLEDGRWNAGERKNLFLAQGNFKDLKEIAQANGFEKVAGIIFDLGMSSYQLGGSGRGFSYQRNEPLDMRMNKGKGLTAADLINKSSKGELYEIFTKYAEELHSGAIAGAVVRARSVKEITRTGELSRLIDNVADSISSKDSNFNQFKLRQTTKARIFQALRIAVNHELENLESGLRAGFDLLDFGGKIAVLTYHSLEDRVVKLAFKKMEAAMRLKGVDKGILQPEREEILANPRAKSAKLRIAERVN